MLAPCGQLAPPWVILLSFFFLRDATFAIYILECSSSNRMVIAASNADAHGRGGGGVNGTLTAGVRSLSGKWLPTRYWSQSVLSRPSLGRGLTKSHSSLKLFGEHVLVYISSIATEATKSSAFAKRLCFDHFHEEYGSERCRL